MTMKPTRAPALGEQLAAVLRDQIVRRQRQPGTHLVEDALAQEHDVSRGPVRDALRLLEAQGLVESRRRGFFVVGLTQDDINDLYELRESIEITACLRAIEHVTPTQIAEAREIVAEMVKHAEKSAADDFAEADMRFHALLYVMGGNRRLQDVWVAHESVFASLMQLTVEEDVDLRPSALDHGRLVDLIELGDSKELESVLRDHLDGARTRMAHAVRLLADGPQNEIAS
ncbi:GntR family transcriptional regulator [Pseudoclavibacter sp. RFBA6]|nr:GntR family transcriptional regulator [Pseudoclavibacter sp. RFBA6]